jgi:hypothetical protein
MENVTALQIIEKKYIFSPNSCLSYVIRKELFEVSAVNVSEIFLNVLNINDIFTYPTFLFSKMVVCSWMYEL